MTVLRIIKVISVSTREVVVPESQETEGKDVIRTIHEVFE